LLTAFALAGCGADSAEASGLNRNAPSAGVGGSSTGDDNGAGTGGGAGVSTPPPEMEVEKSFEAPVATEHYVWTANPKTGRVALIDAATFQVQMISAGQAPTFLAAIPGHEDEAIVLDVVSSDATYIRRTSTGLDKRVFRVESKANAWAISPDGRWAIAWTDATRIANADPTEGFQTISIIDLASPGAGGATERVPRLAIGFRPARIAFAESAPTAFAVTSDGIDVVDLAAAGGPRVSKHVNFEASAAPPALDAGTPDAAETPTEIDAGADDASNATEADGETLGEISPAPDAGGVAQPTITTPDVSITPSGKFAVVRREGSSQVGIVDLATSERVTMSLSGPVTDLDLADTGDRAVAVVRNTAHVDILPIPGQAPVADLTIAGETIGSVVIAKGGSTALLYTNALPVSRITAVTMTGGDPSYRAIDLHAPVLSVFPTPDAQHAIVIHNRFGGQSFQKAGAISVVPLGTDQPAHIEGTDAPPQSVAISPSGDRALVSVRDSANGVYAVYVAQMPSLIIDRFALASPPMSVGIVESAHVGFVAQEHPEGRITFIDLSSGQAHTITGFELAASVVQWPARRDQP
jgi:hypothetical protein